MVLGECVFGGEGGEEARRGCGALLWVRVECLSRRFWGRGGSHEGWLGYRAVQPVSSVMSLGGMLLCWLGGWGGEEGREGALWVRVACRTAVTQQLGCMKLGVGAHAKRGCGAGMSLVLGLRYGGGGGVGGILEMLCGWVSNPRPPPSTRGGGTFWGWEVGAEGTGRFCLFPLLSGRVGGWCPIAPPPPGGGILSGSLGLPKI